MTLHDYKATLETFELDVLEGGSMADYNKALINLINDFYDEALNTPKEDLIKDMLDFVCEVRREQTA
ncbi:MAG: hypothetical protein IKY09_02545 [Methanocorpusculum sp.]|nr:hypothetical protein [Methanocorpusculum sp.]MBR5450192.1 hypothetical protein [Methanocorpusculum sp.]